MIWALVSSASPCYPSASNTTELSHEREELGEVVLLEKQQHEDLVPAREGGNLPSEITETTHCLVRRKVIFHMVKPIEFSREHIALNQPVLARLTSVD